MNGGDRGRPRSAGSFAVSVRMSVIDSAHRQFYAQSMSLDWEQVVVHSVDPAALGQWWAEALGWVVVHSSEDEFEIRPAADRTPGLDFVRVGEGRKTKSRLHLDFRPDDQEAEVARLVAHGARRVDIGQGERPWVVLADPEGNEFCVLSRRR